MPAKALIAGVAVLLVVLVGVGAAVLLTGSGNQDFDGQGSASDDQLISALDDAARVMRDQATRENAQLADGANCFLSKSSVDADAANSFIRCGPVLFTTAPAADHQWMTADLTILDPDELVGVDLSPVMVGTLSRDTALSGGEHLFRPDGIDVPAADLDFPDPDPVASDFSTVVDQQLGLDLDPVESGVVGLGFTMDIEGWTTVDRVRLDDETLIAPEGSTLLVVRYDWSPNDRGGTRPAFAVSVDGTSRSVELPQGRKTLVVAVRSDADDLGINAAEDTIDQTLSLTTGERSADTPMILYRDPANRSIAVNSTIQIPTNARCLSSSCRPVDGLQTQIVLGNAELAWTERSSALATSYSASDAVPSDPGRAFLLVEVRRFENVAPDTSNLLTPELAASMIEIQAGEDSYAATTGLSRSGVLVFEVPADITDAKLVIRPGDNVLSTNSSAAFDYGEAVGEAAIRFPAG